MSIYASSLLIPVGVIVYTALGGLKATFVADYIHTVYVYVVLILFLFAAYGSTREGPYALGNAREVNTYIQHFWAFLLVKAMYFNIILLSILYIQKYA